eukprot:5383252-Lingulodinium_polyedra.AAC.1
MAFPPTVTNGASFRSAGASTRPPTSFAYSRAVRRVGRSAGRAESGIGLYVALDAPGRATWFAGDRRPGLHLESP